MRIKHTCLLLMIIISTGCSGEVVIPQQDGSQQSPDLGYDGSSSQPDTAMPITKDSAVETGISDSSANTDGAPKSDSKIPTSDSGLPTGGPCPCLGNQECVGNKCRNPCNAPTGLCKVTSNCPASEKCGTISSGGYACIPAVAPGQLCDATSKFCPINYVCTSVNASAYSCLPICNTLGANCGNGGKCMQYGQCLFCSKL